MIFAYSDVPHEVRHAQSLDGAGRRRRFPPDGHPPDPGQVHQAGRLGVRRAHRLGQEPDHPARLADPARDGLQSGRHPPPHALRRPGQAGRAALCRLRRPGQARMHHRRARRIRAAPRQRRDRLRRCGLRSASCARPRRKSISSCGTAATTTSPSMSPTCKIVVADPHRPGHELSYHPGETNVRAGRCVRDQQGRHCQPREW